MTLRFGSVCSGIEAASVAFDPLGWKAAWFSEIEKFPSAVLDHHYPDVPNLGDMTQIAKAVLLGEVEAPDMLCGGTPCQAFSVAGLRASLADDRGNLTLKFVELADAIDHVRGMRGKQPAVVFWENVPGVLSTKDNAFGCFLAGLAGEDEPLVAPGGRWSNAGVVHGPQRSVAWRTLDAQYFGLAQRRRRVFVVASARDGFDPAQVLFEWDGLRRDSAPSRQAGEEAAATLDARAEGGGFPGTDGACGGHVHPVAYGGNRTSGPRDVASALTAHGGTGRHDFETETFVTHSLRGEGFDASEDGPGRGTPLVPVAFDTTQITSAANRSNPQPGDPCHPLAAGAHPPAIAFSSKDHGADATADLAPTLRAMNHAKSHANGGGQMGVAYTTKLHNTASNNAGKVFEERSTCLDANSPPSALLTAMQVRRLTPLECERLQGFPDGYTAIPWRGKPASECPDGPRYKALGNSWAVPCAYWIGARIDAQVRQLNLREAA